MAAIASLRYFCSFLTSTKSPFVRSSSICFLRQAQYVARCLLELLLFIGIDVRSVALREAANENRALTPAEKDDRSVPTRLAVSWPCEPSLDDAAAEVGSHLSFFCSALSRPSAPRRGSFPFGQTAQTTAS